MGDLGSHVQLSLPYRWCLWYILSVEALGAAASNNLTLLQGE
jgi:hypothetical protein